MVLFPLSKGGIIRFQANSGGPTLLFGILEKALVAMSFKVSKDCGPTTAKVI
jgi:hypothetical protein